MDMAIRCFGKLKNLAIHFEFGHSLILAIRWSGVVKHDTFGYVHFNKDLMILEEIREKTICEDPDIILVGNKSDMEDKRQVPRAAAVSLAEAHK